ncbi:MAG: helix-turn-helix transcriptional regulator, partial [Oceanospirillum sp.]|nr:helix-turn-helix transcriptional regulator [Oceanospirillum sp.]
MTDTVATQDDTQADVQLPENMPGEQLKKARERMQLDTREVSEQLNLKHSFVQMIEEDNYSALPGATFVRGYLRAYAKLVGIDAEYIGAFFDQGATCVTVSVRQVVFSQTAVPPNEVKLSVAD